MKKMMSLVLVFILIMSMSVSAFAAVDNNLEQNLEEFDIAFAAAVKLNSDNQEDDILPNGSKVKNIIPLYDNNENLRAFYITFSPTGYAVVNNNKLNPSLIEYGRGDKKDIEKIVNSNQKIIYNNPVDVYSNNYFERSSKSGKNLYDFYPELLQPDLELQNEISILKSEMMKNNITTRGDGDYGFIDWGSMPSGSYSSKTITNASSTSWITTSDTSHLADNHCGATASTNIALYYANRGYSNLKINNSKIDTFKAVHKIIGNGPVMMIAGGTKQYFQDRGYSLSSSSVSDFSGIKSAADNNQIQGILLADGIVSWHWILAVGYRQYNSGGNYMRIVNGWDNTIDVFYKINSGSAWISATKYWVN